LFLRNKYFLYRSGTEDFCSFTIWECTIDRRLIDSFHISSQIKSSRVGNMVSSSQSNNNQAELDLGQSSTMDISTTPLLVEKKASKVRFADKVQSRIILSRKAYTADEAKHSWLSPDNKAKMTEKSYKTVDRMEAGKRPRQNSTFRGLETLSAQGADNLAQTVEAIVDAVMDEQDRQWKENADDWDRLAQIYKTVSKESKDLALKRGKSDAREAKKAYRSMETDNTDLDSSLSSAETFQTPKSIMKSGYRKITVASTLIHQLQALHVR
jgi:hypothetical protein